MANIKITFTNKEKLIKKINGDEESIINYYNDCNFLSNKEDKQVESVEFICEGKETGFVGCRESIKIYYFSYDEKAGCYLY